MKDGLALAFEPGLELVGENGNGFTAGTIVGPRVVIYRMMPWTRNEMRSFLHQMSSDESRLTGQHHRLHPLGGFHPLRVVRRVGQFGLSDATGHLEDSRCELFEGTTVKLVFGRRRARREKNCEQTRICWSEKKKIVE